MPTLETLISDSKILIIVVPYFTVGFLLGLILGDFCTTFSNPENHILVWVLFWPLKIFKRVIRR